MYYSSSHWSYLNVNGNGAYLCYRTISFILYLHRLSLRVVTAASTGVAGRHKLSDGVDRASAAHRYLIAFVYIANGGDVFVVTKLETERNRYGEPPAPVANNNTSGPLLLGCPVDEGDGHI